MCSGGGIPSTLDVIDPLGKFHKGGGVASKGGLLGPPKVPSLALKKPPKPVEPNILAAQQHAKEAAIGAYGYSDTSLTGGKGLGSTTGASLWKTLGSK